MDRNYGPVMGQLAGSAMKQSEYAANVKTEHELEVVRSHLSETCARVMKLRAILLDTQTRVVGGGLAGQTGQRGDTPRPVAPMVQEIREQISALNEVIGDCENAATELARL